MRLYEILEKIKIKSDIKDFEVHSLLPLNLAGKNDISYIDKDKYLNLLEGSNAGAVYVNEKLKGKIQYSNLIFVENPHLAFAYTSQFFKTTQINNTNYKTPKTNKNVRIFSGTFIGENVEIGENSTIMPNVVICDDVKIGDNTTIYPNVVIYKNTIIGNNVIIHAGSIIGSDGFGYAHTKTGEHIKIEHFGNVIIEDNVEIGANVTIDRAVFESTIIKNGAKIDNLVQIGHNCVIGEHTILVSQVGFAGSTTTGRNVICGGQVGTGGHIHIGDFVQVAGRGAVGKNLPPNTKWGGHPLMELNEWQKMHIKLRKLTKN
ncbi:UDP-3-O-(3-hydroxymyristoyl)glucosamine N-acyltransferase [Helicobacter sp. MIT 14-3879]|uniref:UDP-3-O-(3-hydroxymyristoyl)glucosamine N-acyltransferase n=1 Tax=Helicobacter sp. MIT 14-3879 TaxID=2040649 RepID=UPI000E1F3584|nr:UDP-3-O-(3-hydroxymyristoyl)glucosamine N-acyltransferase [Helicobacter sp. MIT 14-3879]RDU64651.1 UDP-3-O-(3-hydroxymyristoyl)glucosamine N-acyltransferase [Helicobacter sp. MIT 14-3879]